MKLLLVALVGVAAANLPPSYFSAGSPPTCHLYHGKTVVHFDGQLHKSFHCEHGASSCSCIWLHPSHHGGKCKSLTHKDGSFHPFGGDCGSTGMNTCKCANGTPVPPGITCATHDSEMCAKCDDGYYLSQGQCLKSPCTNDKANCYVGTDGGKWYGSKYGWSKITFPHVPDDIEVTKTVHLATKDAAIAGKSLDINSDSAMVFVDGNQMLEISDQIVAPPARTLGFVMEWCGKVNQHKAVDGDWATDSDGASGCSSFSTHGWWATTNSRSPASYCKKFWPKTTKTESAGLQKINTWCDAGNRNCRHTSTKTAFKCIG